MTRRSTWVRSAAAALVALWSWEALVRSQVQSAVVFVGVLRTDGLLIPAAIFDGHEWWNRWPFSSESDDSITKLPLPVSLAEIPADWLPPGIYLPVQWKVQLQSGRRRTIRLGRLVRPADNFMATLIGIQTDGLPGRRTPPGPADEGEAGIAVAGPAEAARFVAVPDAEGRRLLRTLLPALDKAESDAIAERIAADWQGRSYTFPATPAQRAARPFQGTWWIRAERLDAGRAFYYFTGTKDYGAKPYPDCEATVDFDAVVVREQDGRITAPAVGAYTTFACSRDNAIHLRMNPVGAVHWAGRVLWLIRSDAEDGFEYSLIDPVATTDAEQIQLKGLWQYRGNGG